MDAFGDRLETALNLAKKGRKALADHLGISVQAVGQTVRGETASFNAINTAKAARFLGVNWYWLATGEEEPTSAGSAIPRALVKAYSAAEPKKRALALSVALQILEGDAPSPVKPTEQPTPELAPHR